jgi:hypothetical protein
MSFSFDNGATWQAAGNNWAYYWVGQTVNNPKAVGWCIPMGIQVLPAGTLNVFSWAGTSQPSPITLWGATQITKSTVTGATLRVKIITVTTTSAAVDNILFRARTWKS